MKINRKKVSITTIFNLIALVLGWISYIIDSEAMVKTTIFIVIPYLSFLNGIVTAKTDKSLKKEILFSIIIMLLIVRKIIPIAIFGSAISAFFIMVGDLCYHYYDYENTIIENIDKKNTYKRKKMILSKHLKWIPIIFTIAIKVLVGTSTLLITLHTNDVTISNELIDSVIVSFLTFEFFMLPILILIQGFMSSYMKLDIIKIVTPIFAVWFTINFLLSLSLFYSIVFSIRPLIFLLVGVLLGGLVNTLKNKKSKKVS